MAGLYVPIRGDYTEFQKDIKRLQGIARTSAQELSDIFSNAFSKGDASRGLSQIGMALKKLGAAASTVGAQFKPAIAEISEFAQKCGVSANQVERLVTQMGYAARERQMISSLRTLQRQAGLTESALAQLARHRNLFAESGSIASEGLGVRTVAKIKADIKEAEAAFKQFQVTANLTGESTQRQFEAMTAKVRQFSMELMTANQREAFLRREQYDSLVSQAGRGRTSFAQFEARNTARNAVNAFQELNGRLPRPSEIRQIAQACGASAAQIRRMRDELDHSSNAFKALIGYAQVWLTFGFAHTAADFVKTAMQLENVEVAFKAIYGTSDMAEKKLEYIKQVSNELGLSFMDTAEGAKKLFAAAQGTPVEKEANMVFKAFSNMSAAMKLTGDETKGVFLAISQMISKGKVSAEELRQQLAERMPGAVNLFASSIGVSTQELDKMLQQGGVTLEHFLQFARAVNERYAAGAAQASHTLQAELARIGNTWAYFQKDMTDTGKLAGWARSFNEVFKGMTSAIVKFSDEISNLMTATFAAWIASSLTPGGKLNSVFASLAVTLKAARASMDGFAASTTTAVTRMGMLGKAAKSLMSNPLIAGLLTAGTVFGIEKLLEGSEDKNAFDQSGESLRDIIASRAKAAAADKQSQFTPEETRKLLLEDTEKQFRQFDLGMDSLGLDVTKELSKKRDIAENGLFSSEKDVENVNRLSEAYSFATSRLREMQQASQQAFDSKQPEGFLKVQKDIAVTWGDVEKRLRDADATDEMVKKFEAAFKAMDATAGTAFDNISKHLATFAADSTSAAKTLGLEMDKATSKMFEKLEKASQSSAIGKAAKEVENFQKVAQMLGDSPLAQTFDASTAACGQFANEITTLIGKVGNAEKVSEQYWMQLIQTSEGYRAGTVAGEEFEKAQNQVDAQTKELTDWQGRLATAIFQTASAAGGTDAQFNVMTEALRAAERAGVITEETLLAVLQRVNEIRGAAAAAMAEMADASVYSAADVAFLGANTAKNFKDKNKELWITNKQLTYDSQGKAMPSREALGYQYDREQAAQAIRDSLKPPKKGGKKGGGGSKRVDNTAEKYNSAYEGFRKEIAKLQGEVDKVTLDKKFADMDKALKGSKHNIKELKTEYFEAFNANKVQELRKEIMQLTGDEQALADLEMAEKMKAFNAEMEGIAKAAKELGREVPEDLEKFKDAYEKALATNSREQELQRIVGLAGDFIISEKSRKDLYEAQNELIEIQYEKLKKIHPEIAEADAAMKRLKNEVENNNNVIAGMELGFKRWQKSAGNMAENMADTVENAFKGMEDAFVNFVQTGKLNFTDLANSIIADLTRMTVRASMSGIWDLIGQGLGALAGAFSSSAITGNGMSFAGTGASESASLGLMRHGHALGDVFTGLHGFSNQIVSRPTLFSYSSQLTKFAKGGVMGEAGPEAVMPLMRTASGHLGVRTEGNGQAPVVVNIVNNTGQEAKQESKMDGDGTRSIEVTIGDMAASQMLKSGSSLNKAVRTFTGQSQQVVRR